MWKKLYSNSGLILIAVLAAGVWTSNLYTFIRQSPKLSSTAEAQTAPDVRELGRRVKAKYPGAYDDLTDEDVGRRVKAKYPGAYDDFTDTPAADKERLRTLQQELAPPPIPRDFGAFMDERRRQATEIRSLVAKAPKDATAICNDGTYSYSQSRSGTCSHHGGVKEWLPADKAP
jgi:hypothetical protein